MPRSKQKSRSPMAEAALGFALGAVAGCVLGATEEPVNQAMSQMTSGALLTPVSVGLREMGPLGLGCLLGAAALTAAMTSVVAGVILAATVASALLAPGLQALSPAESVGVWLAIGLAGALGTTMSGATLGALIEMITTCSGLVGLLWVLSIFTAVKMALHFVLKRIWSQGEPCCSLVCGASPEREKRGEEDREEEQWQAVTVEMEQRIINLQREREGGAEGLERRAARDTRSGERERPEREGVDRLAEETEQRSVQETINHVVLKYVDFMGFSGIPMTLTAVFTAGLGLFGFGDYRFVFVVLLALVMAMSFTLMKSSRFNFWMLAACMGMFATFTMAVLTVSAGQEVAAAAAKMRAAGQELSKEDLRARITQSSTLEALVAAFFVARLCQLSLGATVGGPLARVGVGEGKVVVGAATVSGLLLAVVEALAPVLGAGGATGALLGVVGAAGVSMGAAAAAAVGWASWSGTIATLAGLMVGALGMGKFHFVNIGLQVPVAYFFAMTNLF